jgi:hypothetical protein
VQLVRFSSAYLSTLDPPCRFGLAALVRPRLARSHSIASVARRRSSSDDADDYNRYAAAWLTRDGA